MTRDRRIATWAGSCALIVAALCSATLSHAQRLRALSVAVGETAAIAETALGPTLEEALSTELAERSDLELASFRTARFVLRGSITRMDRNPIGTHEELHCEVSLIVSDRRGGSVRAMLRGRARARGAPGRALERAVVRAAVRGALGPLSSQLAQIPRR